MTPPPTTTTDLRMVERSAALAEDARLAEPGGEQAAGLEAGRVELGDRRVDHLAEPQPRDVTAERRRELEAVPAGAGVDHDAGGDLADDRLPVGADVVEAGPAAALLRRHQRGDAAGDGGAQRLDVPAVDRLAEGVRIDLRLRVQRARAGQLPAPRARVETCGA